MTKVYVAADHAGFVLKEKMIPVLREKGLEVEDCGARELNEHDNYPEIIACAASRVSADTEKNIVSYGIVFGKTGQGEAMVANRFKGVRAAEYYGGDERVLTLSRQHNDANILSLGADFVNEDEAREAITLWLGTSFSGQERHTFRIRQIEEVSDMSDTE